MRLPDARNIQRADPSSSDILQNSWLLSVMAGITFRADDVGARPATPLPLAKETVISGSFFCGRIHTLDASAIVSYSYYYCEAVEAVGRFLVS
jgi:hypothetical protein